MVPGIDPKVDYAFKHLFGQEKNKALLIDLLNAVRQMPSGQELVDLEILNPFNDKEALDDKLSILDIKARDRAGRQFNVEMQMLDEAFWKQRILYYWAHLYEGQLVEGADYDSLRPAISVCFLNDTLFPQVPAYHLRFAVYDETQHVRFTDHLEIHLLELPKFTAAVERLADPLDVWLYFLQHGDTLDAEALPDPLKRSPISQALEVMTRMTQSELERERYESRVKAQRDYVSFLKAAEARGRAAGEAEGEARGRAAGEAEGEARGEVELIHLCERVLGRAQTASEQLLGLSAEQRRQLIRQLEQELKQACK